MIAILLMALLGHDPVLTPGVVRPLTRTAICTTRWGLDRRHVTVTMRRAVFAAYGIPWANRGQYELDHLVPRSLGGADDVRNLWPQPWPAAKAKDRVEVRLQRAVCAGTVTLHDAQQQMIQWGQR